MTKERYIAFVDALIAIIATIMVLDLPRPKGTNLKDFMNLGLPFFAYFISFFMIWAVWHNHHRLFKEVKIITARTCWYTGAWVFIMSLFPWGTAIVARQPMAVLPELLYLIIIFVWAVLFSLLEREVKKENPHLETVEITYGKMTRRLVFCMELLGFLVVWFIPIYVLLMGILFIIVELIMQLRSNLA